MRFFSCLVLSLFLCFSLTSAVEDVYEYDPVLDGLDNPPDLVLVGDEVQEVPVEDESPVPVIVLEPDLDLSSLSPGVYAGGELSIGDTPPDSVPFYGAAWVTGTDSRLGRVTLFFPIDTAKGYWGIDSNGYLFNVNSSSVSGYLAGVYNNSVSSSGFDYPRYRDGSSSNWDYYDLHLKPENSNMEIAVSNAPKYSVRDILPFLIVGLLGVIVCFMKRS